MLGRKRRQWVGWCGGYGDDFRPSTGSVCGGRVGGASPLGGTGGGMRENRWRRRMGWPARRERRGGKGGGAGEDKCGGRKRGHPASPRRAGHPMQCGGGGMRGYDGAAENNPENRYAPHGEPTWKETKTQTNTRGARRRIPQAPDKRCETPDDDRAEDAPTGDGRRHAPAPQETADTDARQQTDYKRRSKTNRPWGTDYVASPPWGDGRGDERVP